MSSDAAHTAMTDTSGDIVTDMADASLADRQEAIPGLPNHLVIAHILRSEYFDNPADLARLPAVSRAMCDAVKATDILLKDIDALDAANLGCVSAVKRLKRRDLQYGVWWGRGFWIEEFLCMAAARSRQL